jgi:hypothetical protein
MPWFRVAPPGQTYWHHLVPISRYLGFRVLHRCLCDRIRRSIIAVQAPNEGHGMRDKLKERLAVKVVVDTQDRPLLAPLSTRSRRWHKNVYLRVPAAWPELFTQCLTWTTKESLQRLLLLIMWRLSSVA